MKEDRKKEIAVFRFGVISDFVNGRSMSRKERKRLIKQKCALKWDIPYSEKTRIGESTLRRWIRTYKESGGDIDSLMPSDRSDKGKSRALDDETSSALANLRQSVPGLTVPQIVERMNAGGLVTPGTNLHPSTVYRFLHANDLMEPSQAASTDRRKWEAELPNQIWQTDVMHGPRVLYDGKKRKSYLIAFMDDHSRLVPFAGFYLSETTGSVLDAMKKAVLARGLPSKVYADNGAAYRSIKLEYVAASLGIALVHARPYRPQGKGKIERWFRTVRSQLLAGRPLTGLEELNRALEQWLVEYHRRKHSSTGQSPFERFTANMQCMRTAPEKLGDHFRTRAQRTVAGDRTVTLKGKLFEAPVSLIGRKVELFYHEDEPDRVEIWFDKRSYGFMNLVDVNVNCRVRRDRNRNAQLESDVRSEYRGGSLWKSGGE